MRIASQKSKIKHMVLCIALTMMAILLISGCDSKVDNQDRSIINTLPSDEEVLNKLMSSVNLPGANQVVTDGHYIYFNSSENKFSRADADGGNLVSLNQQQASWPLIADEQFFYAAGSTNGPLTKMKLDGSSHVRAGSGTLSSLVFYQDMIYAIEEPDRTLIRIKTDGTKRDQIVDSAVSSFILRGNSLYIAGKSAQDGIVRYNLKNDSQELLLEAAAGNLQADGNYLYYADLQKQYQLFALDLSTFGDFDTEEAEEDISSVVGSGTSNNTDGETDQVSKNLSPSLIMEYSFDRQFVVFDQIIYFIDSGSQQQLFRSTLNQNNKINRSDATLAVDDAVDNFCLIGPYIYYRRAGINRLYRTDIVDPRPIRIN